MNDTYEVKINRLAYGGEAVGRLADGRTVFIPFAIPGELVRVRLVEEKPRYARAELVNVLEASPDRATPLCQHFGFCGGCHYQHMQYDAQVQVKAAILREQLERIGGMKELPPVEMLAAKEPWYYRNHIQFHLTREGKLGFQRGHSNQSFAVRECHLPETLINQTWPLLDIEPIKGLERLILRAGADDDLMLILECVSDEPLEFNIEGLPLSIIQTSTTGRLVLAGSENIFMEVAGRRFIVTGTAFFQVNTSQAGALVEYILKNLPISSASVVLDVYCGVGLFSANLAPKVKSLVGIEVSPEACDDFTTNLDEFDHVSLYEAPAEDVLREVDFHPDVIVVDPPREGLGLKTVEGILRQGAAHLAYVSCDPATLGRDAKHLSAGGYRMRKLVMVDMFPQTYHIESISMWEKI